MFMIMFVLDDPEKLPVLLEAWEKAGVGGVTILESTGMHRVKRRLFPMRYLPVVYDVEENHLTLISIIEEEALIEACLRATEEVIGSLDAPNTGIFAAWPLSFVKGIPKRRAEA
ncbi:MAG: hypothetical protein GX415_06205 [Chloroflexi bacterium]|nr:hypothetical protein [Anaerolineaceae bacterium]NLI44985.1 hypothetical protein [Chloroflexota bacterium]HOE35205.1 hypothetical protein [Anaerolineaceae bacterium]HOT26133.1 hypothetical protein [Anaerolineaceae bacterium]HQH58327.1 hypothetical protein [Anaerolineaceae bacterium]